MKVAMIYPDHSSEKGISKYSMDLVKNMRKQGIDVEGITYMQGKPETLLKKISKLKEYDIVHIQHEYNLLGYYGIPYFVLFFYLWLFKKKSLITTMHTVLSQKEEHSSGKIKSFIRNTFYKMKNWMIKRSSDKVIVHSRYFRKILINEYGFSEKEIEVLPHAIIEDIKKVSKTKAKKELKLSGKIYLMIGTMNPYHDYNSVVRQADGVGKTILIVTSSSAVNYRNTEKLEEALNSLKKIIKENKFEKFVDLRIGFIPYEEWWKYFSAADLILLPYKGGVGSGIFADAMAMKKPIVASKVPYFKYIAKDYRCMKLVENPKDYAKIIKEAMKPRNYKELKKECERYFKENGLTPISKKYKIIYESL